MSVQYLDRATPIIKVERNSIRGMFNAILYRGWQEDGEHSKAYCVELQFRTKKDAETWLQKNRVKYQEVADHEELPWM